MQLDLQFFFCLMLPYSEQVFVVEIWVTFCLLPGEHVFILFALKLNFQPKDVLPFNWIALPDTLAFILEFLRGRNTCWGYCTICCKSKLKLWILLTHWTRPVCLWSLFKEKKETSFVFLVSLSFLKAYLINRCHYRYAETFFKIKMTVMGWC